MSDTDRIIAAISEGTPANGDDPEEQKGKKSPSQASILVGLALEAGAELFRTPEGEAFATLPIDGRRETWPLRTRTLRRWLSRLYYLAEEAVPGSQGVQDTLGVLEGKALFDGDEHAVHVRVAEHEGAIFLDLADGEWQAVEITPSGWRVVADPPVKFRRARGMLPLPMPAAGGSLDDLAEFVNFATEDDFRLMVAWLVMTLRPHGPYPILDLLGEQGSGKSTAAEVLRSLVDPNEALLRPAPRDERDLVIAASNGRMICLENISTLNPWASDALCRVSTGSGFGTRELYSDSDEALFRVQAPICLNGIVEVVLSGDLLDRSIVLTLPTIESYESEDDLWADFERARPKILGALLDAVSAAMRNVDTIKLDSPPRMADFAKWMVAAAPGIGWDAERLLAAYAANRADANETTLGASTLVGPLREIGEFQGTATDLLSALVEIVGKRIAGSQDWPKSPSALSGDLRRLAPSLRRSDRPLEIEFVREAHGRRLIRVRQLEQGRKTPSPPSPPSPEPPTGDAGDAGDGEIRTRSNGTPSTDELLRLGIEDPEG